jgi:folate-binding protein YgfZ
MFTLDQNKNYLFDLSAQRSLISIKGEKAAEFLQGQLSCDIRNVNENTMQYGTYCNLKGRVLALLDVVAWHGLHLVLPTNLKEPIKRALAQTALVSRVSLHDNPAIRIFGFYYNNEIDLSPFKWQLPTETFAQKNGDNACIYAIGDKFYILLTMEDEIENLCQPFLQTQQLLGFDEWHHLQIRQQRFEIYPNTQGLFTPHRIELHKKGYISFDKGCYKGQEIIARTHYRATLKHGLQLYQVNSSLPPVPGMKIFNIDKTVEIGELIDFSPIGLTQYLILVSILHDHPEEIILEGSLNPVQLEPTRHI